MTKDFQEFLNNLPEPKPSKVRVVLAFPVMILITLCIPFGFVFGAIKAGLSMGEMKFRLMTIALAAEKMNRRKKKNDEAEGE
jgi:hypothetical protein